MGRFNSFGTFVSGNGGPVSFDGTVIAAAGTCAQWKTDNVIVANVLLGGRFVVAEYDVWNPSAGWKVLDDGGCNALEAGGGRWAAFTAGRGVFGDVLLPESGLSLVGTDQRGGAGPDGTLAFVPSYQVGTGLQLRAPHGAISDEHFVVARNVQVLGWGAAVWDGGAMGVTLGRMVAPWQRLRVAGDWRVYYTEAWGVVAHRKDDPEHGYVVATGNAYHHDAVEKDGRLYVGYSTGIQERPEEARVVDVELSVPVTDLTTGTVEPVPAIGKPLWVAWFEFANTFSPYPPGNAVLFVRTGGNISADDGNYVGQWVQGESVEAIETQAATVRKPVAYWDARTWPRWPALPADGWLALQAYCGAPELPAFEANMRAVLDSVPASYRNVALVCQCYTSNVGLTTNLAALVPIYARLARDYPQVTMLLPFTDQGRATGLNDHPEVRPRWEELMRGVLGKPKGGDMGNGIVDGVCVDPERFFMSLTLDAGKRPQDYQQVMSEIEPELFKYGMGQQTNGTGGADPSVLRGRLFLPTGVCPNASPRQGHPQDVRYHVNQTPSCCGIGEVPCLFVDVVNDPPTQWIWRVGGGLTMADYRPVPAVDPGPEPSEVTVLIHSYDPFVYRGDPKGLLVRFDADSRHPIVKIELDLEGDDEPSIPLSFVAENGRDGRYVRALAFKPVRNGTYKLRVTATDAKGNVGKSDGTHTVTVVE